MTDYKLVPVDLLSELAESLACELDARYPASVRSYESQDRKYQAEMEPVLTARKIIAAPPVVQGEPVSAQIRYRRPEKGLPSWSAWQPAEVDKTKPTYCFDEQGWEVEYRLLYTAPQPTSAYVCTVPDDCETLHWRGQILSMNELVSVQPAADEEIHVHIEGRDVLTLPLASSGMSAPRFVVHVPAQPAEQQPAPDVSALVEAAEAALGEIEVIMQEAYNSAYPVCCGRPGSECCGSPDPEWEEADQRMMDRLAPHQKALRDALAAHRKGGDV